MTSTETTTETNGHGGMQWTRPSDLPAHLGAALVPSESPDESPIWGEEMPDPEALRAAVRRAEDVVDLQDVTALAEAKSPSDIAADLDAARQVRTLDRSRELERKKAEVKAEAAEAAHDQELRRIRREAREAAARARVRAEKVSNPYHEVVRVSRGLRWVPLAGGLPALFALIAGAVNVGSQLDRIFPGVPLISWVVDPMITVLLVAIGGAHLYGATTDEGGKNVFRRIEAVGFVLTSAAAVGLHYVDGPGPDAAGTTGTGPLVWLAIPICLGLSMIAAPKLRQQMVNRLEQANEAADEKNREEPLPTPSDLHGKKPEEPSSRPARKKARDEVTATVPAPTKRGKADHRTTLAELVTAGQIDPATVSVNAARDAIGCQWGTARELLAEYPERSQR